jgi:UDP-N-acetylmuramoyl-L-alanyl-D-glutamate--2,6-diaminopimelate ligase
MANNKPKLFSSLPVTCHTDFVTHGSTFVAIPGTKLDGTAFIPEALRKGATTIVVERTQQLSSEMRQEIERAHAQLVVVDNARAALAQLSAQAHNFPAERLKIFGITGTKGKTTSTWLLEHVLRTAGYTTALISTVCNKINGVRYDTALTTPQPDYIEAFLHECVTRNIDYVIIESAAQAFTLHRLDHITFDAAIFTNFSLEHSEFYATQDAYFAAKLQILSHLKNDGIVYVNGDDEKLASLHADKIHSFGMSDHVDYQAEDVQTNKDGISCILNDYHFSSDKLFGIYNLYNMLGVTCIARQFGIPDCIINEGLQTFSGVPGRMQETVKHNGVRFIIDYAHNPASFTALLTSLAQRTEHLIVLFGAGGDRGHERRPLMGAIAAQYAQMVILTTDNPRSENPDAIIRDIIAGIPQEFMHKVIIEHDRKKAIEVAYSIAQPHSIIALLGKGPDEYQLVHGVKTHFSEQEIINSL